MRSLGHILLSALLVSPALADDAKDMAACSAKTNDVERLECFDQLASKRGVAGPKVEAVSGTGKWQVRTETSPVDDSKTIILALPAEERVSKRFETTTPTLILRCQEKKTNAFIGFDFYLGIGEVEVTTRLDKEKAKTTTWNASSDHQAVFAPNAVGFVRELAKHSSLFVRLTPYGESPVSTSFDLRGIVEAVKPLQAACGWK